jgi:hypothetical protein
VWVVPVVVVVVVVVAAVGGVVVVFKLVFAQRYPLPPATIPSSNSLQQNVIRKHSLWMSNNAPSEM